MKLTAGGQLVWDVPKDFAAREAAVVLVATDVTGLERVQTFRIHVKD